MDMDKSGCCPPGSEPFLAPTYKPRGALVKLDDLECYVVGEGIRAVIFNYDIYGFNGGRTRLMCDQIADAGYLVILPDYYRNDSWPQEKPPGGPDTFEWIHQFTWEKVEKDLQQRVLPYLAEKGVTALATVGTCWGAWVVLKACTSDKFRCGVNWHPSFQCAGVFGENEQQIAEMVRSPQLIMPAGGDKANVMEDGQIIKILKSKPFGGACEHKFFKEVSHGFMTRGDLEKEANRSAVKEAMELALLFLDKHMKS